MGLRGPLPKPTRLRILQGNPGKRALPKGEPQPKPGIPRCPRWLSANAKAEWRRIVPELKRLGLLTIADLAGLCAYCQAFAELQDATRTIDREGRIVTVPVLNGKGEHVGDIRKAHPAVKLQRDAFARVKSFLCEFGLSPATRPKLAGMGKSNEGADPAERFLNDKRA